ncbi:MAG: UDP-N-acetylmuramoyl-tripeptide--D-alanyl-D-alanine ligase, partial [Bacteroidales bacterium]|nr:UDP-N-acetylmuramoyl-tripeptide--D-alanyl-D-alanine ligase [Bacteroidales bacterium]
MMMEELYRKYISCGGVVTTDSRAIKGGEMFFALKGENFDGNAYALKALEAGAAYAVVNEG